ncbi:conserved Plasmodium protein, unknown function [Plasmodium vivax]|uniref:DUF7641 domain-containing protein n=6 Tax=Plasmodium vivax TaxID=5855 RepID=A5K8S6_PLAVS|nr:hypothetical protein, conserved [Plasmodium vivax]KMZ77507.1 hypothetical protein PVIIG_01477 [Plasmodium vivax India VII]KMZ84669.1 hypothetical protein PVBG_00449 [Plasmodium vivax Brazil I]KMZ89947.1 hypothetical protein PVMG_03508 [Plasmodium vivax Mauritania I]KMZ96667.1 hypothetical protein PVNG_05197 [Plasmodium vivax North Korean]EDL44222.1 hypothetical protein, conserved [Plasmodium vivax]|eukprot:XP_001613949.1 hypothetical protein [Plasmodium vivax Sal-1]
MDQIRNRLDHYQPDDKTKAFCRKYIFFVTFYTFFVLILLIYSFFSTKLSIYGWLLFTNLYFCVFPIFSFIGKSYIPSLLRFYNWMLLVSSIISIYIIIEGIFTYSAKDLSLMITYGVLTWVNTALCWKATQSIFDGVRTQHSLLDSLNPKSNGKKGNNDDNKKWGLKKKFFGKGKTTKDSHYVEV